MKDIFGKTFGGLDRTYYLRQLFFGSLFTALICIAAVHGSSKTMWAMIPYSILCSLLYPYSRFVYEGVMGYIMGDNLFLVNAVAMLMTKYLTMSLCWIFSPFIAPIGLLYLYWYHTKHDN